MATRLAWPDYLSSNPGFAVTFGNFTRPLCVSFSLYKRNNGSICLTELWHAESTQKTSIIIISYGSH